MFPDFGSGIFFACDWDYKVEDNVLKSNVLLKTLLIAYVVVVEERF